MAQLNQRFFPSSYLRLLALTLMVGLASLNSNSHADEPAPASPAASSPGPPTELLYADVVKIVNESDFRRIDKIADLQPFVNPNMLKGMAEPGQSWNSGCVVEENQPGKRLAWAEKSSKYVLMVYESGGFAYFVNIALIPVKTGKTAWQRQVKRVPADLAALRKLLNAREIILRPGD